MSSSPADVLKAATSLFAFATDNEPEPNLTDSLKAATAVTTLGSDVVQENTKVADALLATTAVVALGSSSTSSIDNWTKNAIIKLKNHSDTDKGELQRLNIQLQGYLENVRILEQLNKNLIKEVDKAKESYAPKLFDRGQYDPELNSLRVKLEQESNECVKYKARIEESENICQHIGQRIKFYNSDVQVNRQKINALENQLADINSQRDYLIRSANLAEESISREQQRISAAEKDLENLINKLKNDRSKNKQIEFEMQTLNDELAFLKAVFQEEISDMRLKVNGGGLTSSDLTNFYKNELVTAIRQIRDDFTAMSDQQLADYKDHKENELKLAIQQNEKERLKEQQLKSQNEANKDLDIQSSNELRSTLEGNKKEMNKLNSDYGNLNMRLSHLEESLRSIKNKNQDSVERRLAEIEKLKEQNGSMENEVDYWDRVTRNKLETEIQTYRSILNSQIRLMQSFDDTIKIIPVKPPQKKPSVAIDVIVKPTPPPEPPKPTPPSGPVEILRQVFDYFDVDKTGRINSSELERVLERLNVKLSKEAYEQILNEGDKDMSRDIDFSEFCKIMLPVLNGKFEDDELYYAFKKFDLDGSGYISTRELRQILSKIGQNYTEAQILELVSSVAADPNRGLSFPEFSQLMRQPTPSRLELEARHKARLQAEAEAKRIAEERFRAQYESEQREKARLAAEAKRQKEETERLRLAAEAESKRQAEERFRLQYEADQREKARLAAEAEAKRQEQERYRLQYEAEQREKARLAAEAEAKRQEQERYRLQYEAEQRERTRLAAEAETRRQAEEREYLRLQAIERDRLERERLERLEKERLDKERFERLERERLERERKESERQKQIGVLKQVFDYFDKDKTGQIDASEMDAVLLKLGVKLSKEAFDKMLKDADMDLTGEISFAEFCKLMLPVFTGDFGDTELYYAFKKFDKTGDGYLSVTELRQILSKIGQNFSEAEVVNMMRSVGCDINKGLDFQGFSKLMKGSK